MSLASAWGRLSYTGHLASIPMSQPTDKDAVQGLLLDEISKSLQHTFSFSFFRSSANFAAISCNFLCNSSSFDIAENVLCKETRVIYKYSNEWSRFPLRNNVKSNKVSPKAAFAYTFLLGNCVYLLFNTNTFAHCIAFNFCGANTKENPHEKGEAD